MATFKCLRSGNTVTFTNAYDIEQMRRQIMDYEEVKSEGTVPDESSEKIKAAKEKQRAYKGHPDNVAA